MVELRGEGADAGGRRAHLDDEVAGFGHHRLHGAPAAPAVARVEAEDLPAPPSRPSVALLSIIDLSSSCRAFQIHHACTY